ncbi:S1C family serine protease [Floccifex sp.]|uniref:S1C family serine protease n=1 Tax=Floccifex sp. TaxID=2815810 RepID=UPI002A748225|nr:trypsin-like peptidase domain-containing protein [Floccifex sp.]MDD7280970.1 trypsin-like peptidase domain-containing protein [Erysipelotrichaceae bacterium]MDY2957638.1 trypsin-like peptidase domain-containing protein [Floccifex sp.]
MSEIPPKFNKKSNKSNIITIVICCVLSAIIGFVSARIGAPKNESGVTIVQQQGSSHSGEVEDVSDIASKCGPSVVEITTESVSMGNSYYGQYISTGAGSGVIISEDGYIVTNNHVIEDANRISVKTNEGDDYEATLVGTDPQTDIAVIKVDAKDLTPATFGDSSELEVGNVVVAIGNPLGELGGTVTTGIISALERQITVENEVMTLLQTDAAINPGNSGGGLFDDNGNLIGIVNAKESSTGIEGLGFAIPINNVIDVIDELIENGSVTSRPVLGVSLYDVTANSQYYQRSEYDEGVYIVQIVEGGAADQAGLEQNDRIVSFDGQKVSTAAEVKSILRKHNIGDSVKIVVERNDKEITKTVVLQQSNN